MSASHARRARRLRDVLLLSLVLTAGAARADGEMTASEWKERGDAAMVAGRAAEALDAYRRAVALEPSPTLTFNLGRALLAVGDFTGALEAFERYDRTAPAELKQKTHRLAEVMAELRSKLATLEVAPEGAGATGAHLSVRGKPIGRLPIAPFAENPGVAEVRVERDGYEPFVRSLELASGSTTKLAVALRPIRVITSLAVSSTPQGALVEVDGAPSGAAPVTLELAPGEHRISLRAARYKPRDIRVSLASGKSQQLDVQLLPESAPLTSRWYFWAGVGIVTAGVATLIIAANVERSPSRGSLGTFDVP